MARRICNTPSVPPSIRQDGGMDDPTIDLSVLTPRQRLVIVLHYYCDWTYAEIAQAVGISDVTLRKSGSRALARLRDELTP